MINAKIGASAKDNVRSDLGSDTCSFISVNPTTVHGVQLCSHPDLRPA